jgi:hypothetical protein
MIRIAVTGNKHTEIGQFVSVMDDYDPLIMGRTMKTMFTEAIATVNGQTVEFDIYESREFGQEFGQFNHCDAYIILADPKHFSSTEYTTALQYILKFENKAVNALPTVLVAVGGKSKDHEKLTKFASDNKISFASISNYTEQEEIKKIYVNVLEKILPNLGPDRLTSRPPIEKTPHIKPHRLPPMDHGDMKKKPKATFN